MSKTKVAVHHLGGCDRCAWQTLAIADWDEYKLVHHCLLNGKKPPKDLDVDVLVGWGEKVEEIKHITSHFGIPLEHTAFVGDGKNDMSVFSVVALPIAFNPEHEEVAKAAKVTVREADLRSILPHIIQ